MTIVARTESNLYLTTYILKGKYTIYEFLMTALRGNLVATKKWFLEIDCKAIISISILSQDQMTKWADIFLGNLCLTKNKKSIFFLQIFF